LLCSFFGRLLTALPDKSNQQPFATTSGIVAVDGLVHRSRHKRRAPDPDIDWGH
jgi:hypothetical protein